MGSQWAGFSICNFQAQKLRLMDLAGLRHVGSSGTRDQIRVSCIGRQILYHWATREAPSINIYIRYISSVQFSRSVMFNSSWPQRRQHTKLPCPSLTPGACSNSCPLSQWCHPTVSSSVIPFSSCLQSFLASGSFPVSEFFASGGQSIRASASTSFLPINIQDWFPLLS